MWIWQGPIKNQLKKFRNQNADEKKPETPTVFQVLGSPARREQLIRS
jgi:signal-transduction protein with cAMP-binding, CBS, and nucleotidyltransferase domain